MRSSPDRDPFISDDELQYIQSTVDVEKEDKKIVPWKSLLTSPPVYAITVAQVSLNWGDNTMLTQMPTFLAGSLLQLYFRYFETLFIFPYVQSQTR